MEEKMYVPHNLTLHIRNSYFLNSRFFLGISYRPEVTQESKSIFFLYVAPMKNYSKNENNERKNCKEPHVEQPAC